MGKYYNIWIFKKKPVNILSIVMSQGVQHNLNPIVTRRDSLYYKLFEVNFNGL